MDCIVHGQSSLPSVRAIFEVLAHSGEPVRSSAPNGGSSLLAMLTELAELHRTMTVRRNDEEGESAVTEVVELRTAEHCLTAAIDAECRREGVGERFSRIAYFYVSAFRNGFVSDGPQGGRRQQLGRELAAYEELLAEPITHQSWRLDPRM